MDWLINKLENEFSVNADMYPYELSVETEEHDKCIVLKIVQKEKNRFNWSKTESLCEMIIWLDNESKTEILKNVGNFDEKNEILKKIIEFYKAGAKENGCSEDISLQFLSGGYENLDLEEKFVFEREDDEIILLYGKTDEELNLIRNRIAKVEKIKDGIKKSDEIIFEYQSNTEGKIKDAYYLNVKGDRISVTIDIEKGQVYFNWWGKNAKENNDYIESVFELDSFELEKAFVEHFKAYKIPYLLDDKCNEPDYTRFMRELVWGVTGYRFELLFDASAWGKMESFIEEYARKHKTSEKAAVFLLRKKIKQPDFFKENVRVRRIDDFGILEEYIAAIDGFETRTKLNRERNYSYTVDAFDFNEK